MALFAHCVWDDAALSAFVFDSSQVYAQDEDHAWKPEGFWLSTLDGSPHSWQVFARKEWDYASHPALLFNVDMSNILMLDTPSSTDDVPFLVGNIDWTEGGLSYPNWQKLARKYDGVYVSPRVFKGADWVDGWDVDSLCIWNLRCVSPDYVVWPG